LQGVPLTPVRLVVGALLLVFDLQWLRKGILRVSQEGWAIAIGERQVEEDVGDGFDWTRFVLAFTGVSLEGLEVAVIVVGCLAAAVRRRVPHHVRNALRTTMDSAYGAVDATGRPWEQA
jgi:uncharacterized membrane protein